jgi:formate hydrogenlyase subunit 4
MYEIIFFLLVPFLALLYEGIYRKVYARFQNRIGPPVLQPFYDILKLFSKKKIKRINDPFFKYAPILYFISIYVLFLFIPFSMISFEYDFIFVLYLTILASAFYVLAGLSSDNPYGIIGSTRDMILMILYEITLVITVFSFILKAGVLSFSDFNPSLLLLSLPISSLGLFITSMIEAHVTPFDTTEAPTEIMGGSRTEYSGSGLAFMNLSAALRRLFFTLFLPMLFFGKNIFILLPMSFLFLILYTISQATTSRYRVDQVFKVYSIIMFLVLIEFIFVMWGIQWA